MHGSSVDAAADLTNAAAVLTPRIHCLPQILCKDDPPLWAKCSAQVQVGCSSNSSSCHMRHGGLDTSVAMRTRTTHTEGRMHRHEQIEPTHH